MARYRIQGAGKLGVVFLTAPLLFIALTVCGAEQSKSEQGNWLTGLSDQASKLGLPTRFLRILPPDFIVVEFADLRAFAAEYHPENHHMVLDRILSFNGAGRTLRPLAQMNHRDVATLYHELFHAYLDYVTTESGRGILDRGSQRLLAFAKDRQECRYTSVSITPFPQKKTVTEPRLLGDQESWEALNESWAVFVGWAIWGKLEVRDRGNQSRPAREKFRKLLKKADDSKELVGYYEPKESKERAVTHKRYLGPGNRITRSEASVLLEIIFEETAENASWLTSLMVIDPPLAPGGSACTAQ